MPQGTIRTFDHTTQTGSLLDDALVEWHFDREAFAASGLQELRLGQRVRYVLEGPDERVSQLNVISL
jgi:cold shock CspA family protein